MYKKEIIPYAPELLLEYLEFMEQDEDDAVWDNSFDVIVKDLENHTFV